MSEANKGNSIIRRNLLSDKHYSPYCGELDKCSMPRTRFSGRQWLCPDCGWTSSFDHEFIYKYRMHWGIRSDLWPWAIGMVCVLMRPGMPNHLTTITDLTDTEVKFGPIRGKRYTGKFLSRSRTHFRPATDEEIAALGKPDLLEIDIEHARTLIVILTGDCDIRFDGYDINNYPLFVTDKHEDMEYWINDELEIISSDGYIHTELGKYVKGSV